MMAPRAGAARMTRSVPPAPRRTLPPPARPARSSRRPPIPASAPAGVPPLPDVLAFILRRLLLMVPTTLGIALVIFSLYHLAPGDPRIAVGDQSNASMGAGGDDESRYDKFRRDNGLDRTSSSSSSTTSARST